MGPLSNYYSRKLKTWLRNNPGGGGSVITPLISEMQLQNACRLGNSNPLENPASVSVKETAHAHLKQHENLFLGSP
jgi:hypothetical protein